MSRPIRIGLIAEGEAELGASKYMYRIIYTLSQVWLIVFAIYLCN